MKIRKRLTRVYVLQLPFRYLVEHETCARDYRPTQYNFYCNNITKKERCLNISILLLLT